MSPRWQGTLSRLARYTAVVLCTALLWGCALPRMIDSEVESFVGSAPAVPGSTYRFERLPSQQARGLTQDHLETMAEAALARAGLVRNDAQARYSVQVEARVVAIQSPPRPHFFFEGPIVTGQGAVLYPAPMLVLEPPWYSHTVRLLVRETASMQVCLESTASFDGPWSDSSRLLPVVMDAALRDFPTPPPGRRKVVIELAPGNTPTP